MRWLLIPTLLTQAGGAAAEPPAPWRETAPVYTMARAPDVWPAPVAPWSEGADFVRSVEGWVEARAWRREAPDASAGVIRDVIASMQAAGWTAVFSCVADGCGGFDFRAALRTPPPPALRLDLLDYAVVSLRRRDDWAVAIASRAGGSVGLTLATIAQDDDAAVTAAGEPAVEAPPRPVEPIETPLPAPVSDDIGALLAAGGRAILLGVDFDFGALRFASGAGDALDRAAAALAAQPDLRVAVVGHTDNAGALDVNLRVSAERARLVAQALIERGVAPSRIEAHGAGWLAPLASNDTEEGRATNRRVELVAR